MNRLPPKSTLVIAMSATIFLMGSFAEANQSWTNTYNTFGQVLTADGPRTDLSDLTTYTYDTSGNLATITNALGHVTQLQNYNGRGQPGKVIDANGVETILTYHVRGWLETATVKDPGANPANDAITTYGYDNVGQVTSITLPDGVILNYEYDAAQRLDAIYNNDNERIEYTLDDAGNRTGEDIKNSSGTIVRSQTRAFDELSRLMNDVGATSSQTTHYDYDTNNNPTQITDPKTNATGQAFDALNRLITQTDPESNLDVSYTYDDQDRINTVTDQRGLVTTYNYDGLDNLTSLVSPDTGTTNYSYDDAGNRTQMTDARSIVTDYTYDALNRLTSISYPANTSENVTYSYDDTGTATYGKGRLTGITDESGTMAFSYDHRGNLATKTYSVESTNYSLTYSYDLANNITQVTYPSGRLVNYSYDNQGRIDGITTQENAQATAEAVISSATYLPFGPLQSYTYGNGMTQTMLYDPDYRITDIEAVGNSTILDLNYGYDLNSNITTLADQDNAAYTQTFDYDKVNRLTDADGNYGVLDYQYDGVGNRTQKTTTDGPDVTTETYTYSTSSNQLDQVAFDDGTTQTQRLFQYDDNGNLIKDTKPDSTVLDLTYTHANRFGAMDKNTTPTAAYLYNALGQRTAKVSTNPVLSAHYHYDEAGRLLATSTDTGAARTEYIYLGLEKVAMLVDDMVTNLNPVAVNDTATTTEDTAITVDVLLNDTDGDSNPLTITGVTQGTSGGVTFTSTDLTYTPNTGYTGSDNFTYTISDGQGGTDTATVTMTINGSNTAPVAANDAATTTEDTAITIDPLVNDTDGNNDPLTITGITQGTSGTVTFTSTNVTYTPNTGYTGSDTFTYTISDGNGGTDTATVTMTINASGGGGGGGVVVVFTDEFATDLGWTVNPNSTDTATTGLWAWGQPQATNAPGPRQLSATVSGTHDLSTGPLSGSNNAGTHDVDGGVTSIQSPSMILPTLAAGESLKLSFSYYFSHNNNASKVDYFRVSVVGTSTTTLVFDDDGTNGIRDAVWTARTLNLDSFAGQTIQLLFEAADEGGGSLVEAAVDNVKVETVIATDYVFHDDFETDKGWSVDPNTTDTATKGLWARANPESTNADGIKQLGGTTSGLNNLVTGPLAGDAAGGNHDVDGGLTSIRSPDIVLPTLTGNETLELSLNYYFAHNNTASVDDYLRVTVVGTTNTVVYEELGAADNDNGAWENLTFTLDSYAGQTVYLLIEATDGGVGSISEAAIDDVNIMKLN